jgi:hypothetical protein
MCTHPSHSLSLFHSLALHCSHGIRGLVIDPYNEIDHTRPPHIQETEYVSALLSKVWGGEVWRLSVGVEKCGVGQLVVRARSRGVHPWPPLHSVRTDPDPAWPVTYHTDQALCPEERRARVAGRAPAPAAGLAGQGAHHVRHLGVGALHQQVSALRVCAHTHNTRAHTHTASRVLKHARTATRTHARACTASPSFRQGRLRHRGPPRLWRCRHAQPGRWRHADYRAEGGRALGSGSMRGWHSAQRARALTLPPRSSHPLCQRLTCACATGAQQGGRAHRHARAELQRRDGRVLGSQRHRVKAFKCCFASFCQLSPVFDSSQDSQRACPKQYSIVERAGWRVCFPM